MFKDEWRRKLLDTSLSRTSHATDEAVRSWLRFPTRDNGGSRPDGGHKNGRDVVSKSHGTFYYESSAYQWLIGRLRLQTLCNLAEAHAMTCISQKILKWHRDNSLVHAVPSTAYNARFQMDWNIHTFLELQSYGMNSGKALRHALTLTGRWNQAQALTCEHYIMQTWPVSGPPTLQFVADSVNASDHHCGQYACCYSERCC